MIFIENFNNINFHGILISLSVITLKNAAKQVAHLLLRVSYESSYVLKDLQMQQLLWYVGTISHRIKWAKYNFNKNAERTSDTSWANYHLIKSYNLSLEHFILRFASKDAENKFNKIFLKWVYHCSRSEKSIVYVDASHCYFMTRAKIQYNLFTS